MVVQVITGTPLGRAYSEKIMAPRAEAARRVTRVIPLTGPVESRAMPAAWDALIAPPCNPPITSASRP
jgi:hypothetical protein